MLHKITLFCFCLLLSALGIAQDQGRLFIYVDKKNAIIKLDDGPIHSRKDPYLVSTGIHVVKAWAPTYKLLIDTFDVKSAGVSFFNKKLEHTDEYKKYRELRKGYLFEKYGAGILTVAFAAVTGGYYYGIKQRVEKELLAEALEIKGRYDAAISASSVDQYRTDYLKKKEEYDAVFNSNKKYLTISAGIITAGIICEAYFFYKASKSPKPVYHETPLLSRANFYFLPYGKKDFSAGLCLTF